MSFYSPVITNAAEAAQSDKLHLFRYVEDPRQIDIAVYEEHGGYQAWRKVLKSMTPAEVIAEVKNAGVRGRGGAGFPAGMKWGFIPKDSPKPRYLVCNADESEPGTCKDRVLMERDPHAMLEGMAIAAYAIGCHLMFVYIRGEFGHSIDLVRKAVAEAYKKGYLGKNVLRSGFDLECVVHTGGGAYICGEETALLNSLEGEKGLARIKPPFPAISGLYGCPTIINNVETLATISHIINRGAAWYKTLGTERSTGTKIFSLSGHVKQPGNYELVLGHNLKDLIYNPRYGGGILGDKKLKGVIPGGSSTPFLTGDMIDLPLDYESLAAAGSMLGSGAVIVFHEETCIVWVIANLIRFYRHESCGKCTPCRLGTAWLEPLICRIEAGQGRPGDVEKIESICENILGRTVCPLGDAAVMPIQSAIKHWRDEWQYHIDHGKCPVPTKFEFK